MIECSNFQQSDRKDGGTCLIGLHNGKPSFGVCSVCEHKGKSLSEIPVMKSFRVKMKKKGCKTCIPQEITFQTKSLSFTPNS